MTHANGQSISPRLLWSTVLFFLALAAFSGWLFGWLIGASQSPVVAAALPLLIAVLTALGLGSIKSTGLDENLRRSFCLALTGLIAGLFFLGSCWWGIQCGIKERMGYQPINAMKLVEQYEKLEAADKPRVLNAYWRIRIAGITNPQDQELVLGQVSIFVDEHIEQKSRTKLEDSIDPFIDKLLRFLPAPKGKSNGYAPLGSP